MARSRHLEGKGITAAAGDWGAVRAEKNRFTAGIPDSTVEGLYGAGIDYLEGEARFVDPHALTVDGVPVQTRFVVLAAGARPMALPIDGAGYLVTSDAFLDLPALPQRIVFVGGGFISFEFAHFAARLGAARGSIHILEAAARPLGPFDAEMVDLLVDASQQERISISTGDGVTGICAQGEGFVVTTASGRQLEADLVVHGGGRVAEIEGLDPAAAGIAVSNRGIVVNEQMRTSNPKVFAVGDCAATVQLARVARFRGCRGGPLHPGRNGTGQGRPHGLSLCAVASVHLSPVCHGGRHRREPECDRFRLCQKFRQGVDVADLPPDRPGYGGL